MTIMEYIILVFQRFLLDKYFKAIDKFIKKYLIQIYRIMINMTLIFTNVKFTHFIASNIFTCFRVQHTKSINLLMEIDTSILVDNSVCICVCVLQHLSWYNSLFIVSHLIKIPLAKQFINKFIHTAHFIISKMLLVS